MATAADNVEVMFLPKDVYDLPGTVCQPGGPPNGMAYLGPFLPNTTAIQADDAYWFTLRLVSQYPGWIAPSNPVTTSSLLVAQPSVPDANGSPVTSPVKSDNPQNHLGTTMTDWIDRPPPGGASVIGSWTFEQTAGMVNSPPVTFTFDFALEHDPRILTVDASREPNGNLSDNDLHGHRSYTVTLTDGSQRVSVTATNALASGDPPTTDDVDGHSFATSDSTGTLMDLIVNVRWIDDNLFVVVTPKDFGDPAVASSSNPFNPFGEGGGGFGGGFAGAGEVEGPGMEPQS